MARHFSIRGRELATQFDLVPHQWAPISGAPLVEGALAWLDLRTHAVHEAGDHTIVVGEVVAASGPVALSAPLTYHAARYQAGAPRPV